MEGWEGQASSKHYGIMRYSALNDLTENQPIINNFEFNLIYIPSIKGEHTQFEFLRN